MHRSLVTHNRGFNPPKRSPYGTGSAFGSRSQRLPTKILDRLLTSGTYIYGLGAMGALGLAVYSCKSFGEVRQTGETEARATHAAPTDRSEEPHV